MILRNRLIFAICAQTVAVIFAFCTLGAGPFSSGKINYVIELFTSQGCSFCPRADRLLATLAGQPDVVALSFPVDYWDYNGWRDTLASPAYSARQRAYAAAHGEGQVYTPQVVVNGLAGVAGGNRDEIDEALKTAKGLDGALSVPLHLFQSDGHYVVEVAEGSGGPAGVFVLRIARSRTVHIQRGENAGQNVTYTNVVQAINKLGEWTGQTVTFEMPSMALEGDGFVVLVQKGTPERLGAILAAAKTDGL